MSRPSALARQRKWLSLGAVAVAAVGGYWTFFSTGLPVWYGPSARPEVIAAGRELFEHEWAANDPLAHGDGLGPVFNATSCADCHFQGGTGGGGPPAFNAVHYEVLARPTDPTFRTGTLHKFSVNPADHETAAALRKKYPVQAAPPAPPPPPPEPGHCNYVPPAPSKPADFDPIRTVSVQTTALFGIGWIDRISEKAIVHNYRARTFAAVKAEMSLDFSAVPVGRLRTLPDGRVGRFGWKAQSATVRDFVATACANELGLGTPDESQAAPLMAVSAPTAPPDLDKKQFKALVAFVDTLPRPVEAVPPTPAGQAAAARGKALFAEVGCAACHVPDIGGVKGVYTDFLLYALDDPKPAGQANPYGPDPLPDFPRPDGEPRPEEWKTQPLWGVADSAPYFHDGQSPTLTAAVLRHQGDAKTVTAKFQALPAADQKAVISFLQTLKAPAEAAKPPVVVASARK